MEFKANLKNGIVQLDYNALETLIDTLGTLWHTHSHESPSLDHVYLELLAHYDVLRTDKIESDSSPLSKSEKEETLKAFIQTVNLVRIDIEETQTALETAQTKLANTIAKRVAELEFYTVKDVGNKVIDINMLKISSEILTSEIKSGINRCEFILNLCKKIGIQEH